jgi:3-hydroxyisobutyrate dehydrogenase-like beta-hydroxyacid dehydrogenase
VTIAVLGLGRMGQRMAAHVVRDGHQTLVWNRSPGRAAPLVALGATEATTVADAVIDADVVVMMLADPASSEAVLEDVCSAARPGTLVVDATTVGPEAARALGETARQAGLRFVDAPVLGTVGPAQEGTLGSFVGGTDADVAPARPVIDLWCDPARVLHTGPVGTANALKLVVNVTIGIVAAGAGEALRLARDLGVDRDTALTALAGSPVGWFMAQKGDAVDTDEHEDVAFSLDLLAKDLALATESGERPLPLAQDALDAARAASADGRGGQDYAALASWIERS